jgi:hypothetical protein
MSTFTAIKKKNDELFNETLPFNPVADGWDYTGACCCEIKFQKGNIKLFAHSERKILKVYKAGKKDKLVDVFRLPNNQLEFLIKTNGINIS